MKIFYQRFFILLVLIIQLELINSYPSSATGEQRAFLQCLFSPIACKRSLSAMAEIQNPSLLMNKNDFQECISQHNPNWFCLHNPSQDKFEYINPID